MGGSNYRGGGASVVAAADRWTGALSDERIEHLLQGSSRRRVELTDAAEPGLRFRLGPGGGRWSLLVRRGSGERRRIKLGAWPMMRTAHARAAARLYRRHEPQAQRAELGVSLDELIALYAEERLPELSTGEKTLLSLNVLLGSLGDRPACTLTEDELAFQIASVGLRGPVHAQRALAYAKAMFAWALRKGLMTGNPAADMRVRRVTGFCIGADRLMRLMADEDRARVTPQLRS